MNSTQLTHNGITTRVNAPLGVITKAQAARLIKLFGTSEFSDGHQLYRSVHGADNCWNLRKFNHLATR